MRGRGRHRTNTSAIGSTSGIEVYFFRLPFEDRCTFAPRRPHSHTHLIIDSLEAKPGGCQVRSSKPAVVVFRRRWWVRLPLASATLHQFARQVLRSAGLRDHICGVCWVGLHVFVQIFTGLGAVVGPRVAGPVISAFAVGGMAAEHLASGDARRSIGSQGKQRREKDQSPQRVNESHGFPPGESFQILLSR